MDVRRFLLVLLVCLLAAATALVAATRLDVPELACAGVGLGGAAFVAQEIWHWRGDARGWALMVLTVGAAVLLGFRSSVCWADLGQASREGLPRSSW